MTHWLRRTVLAAIFVTPVVAPLAVPTVAQAQNTVTFAYLADPSYEAALWALRHGKVPSKVKVEATPLHIPALIQATAARTYDVIMTAAVAVPRARERGLDLKIIGTGLRYHASGEGAGIWVKKGSPIKSAEDLKGKKLGVYSLGSAGITLIRIALADVHGLNVAVRGGDLQFIETPGPALPAALASGSIDAATLIHSQAYKAMQTGDFVVITQTAADLTKKFGVRMVSAVYAGYGDKLAAHPDDYKEFLKALHASVQYALQHPDEVFPAVAADTKTDVGFFKVWYSKFSEIPVLLSDNDMKAIGLLWKRSVEMGILKQAPPVAETVWAPALAK